MIITKVSNLKQQLGLVSNRFKVWVLIAYRYIYFS